MPAGKVLAGSTAAFVQFASFSSKGNERWLYNTPLRATENGSGTSRLRVTKKKKKKCARQRRGVPDFRAGLSTGVVAENRIYVMESGY